MGNAYNPMVLLITIGKYSVGNELEFEIDGYLNDLIGIENDIMNMVTLFGDDGFGYDIYPKYDLAANIQTTWTEQQMKDFLEDRALFLSNNIGKGKRYDSLILIVSAHGIPQYVMTSDGKKFSKVAIHRTFSYFANLRTIPRMILFDCCAGGHTREESVIEPSAEEPKAIEMANAKMASDMTKQVEEKDVFDGRDAEYKPWTSSQKNPDHLLATINAANAGFTSKLNRQIGSYLIYNMFCKYRQALQYRSRRDAWPMPFLHEVMDEIQTELQEAGKQLPTAMYNDDTRYLTFCVKEAKDKGNDDTAMSGDVDEKVDQKEDDGGHNQVDVQEKK